MRIRSQMLLAYGGFTTVTFAILIGVCAAVVFSLGELIVNQSKEHLRTQIIGNAIHVMTEAGEVLTARINEGAAALVLPVVFALRDAATTQPSYSLDALPSYADNHVSLLKPPTTRVARYSCLSSGDALRDAGRTAAVGSGR